MEPESQASGLQGCLCPGMSNQVLFGLQSDLFLKSSKDPPAFAIDSTYHVASAAGRIGTEDAEKVVYLNPDYVWLVRRSEVPHRDRLASQQQHTYYVR